MTIVISILATYMLSFLLSETDGPFGIFMRLRNIRLMSALSCYNCTAVWVGAFFALYIAEHPLHWFITSLGLSGGAVLIHYIDMGRA